MPVGARREARMVALQVLYEFDTTQHNAEEVLGYIRRAGLIEESAGRGLIDKALVRRPEGER